MSLTKVSYSMINGAPVNVLDYGAVGDGVTDDTAAIQAAINSGAKQVIAPAGGIYKITNTLNINVSGAFQLDFNNSELLMDDATGLKTHLKAGDGITQRSVQIDNVAFTRQQAATAGYAIDFDYVGVSGISGCRIYGNNEIYNGIRVRRGIIVNIQNNYIDNCVNLGIYLEGTDATLNRTVDVAIRENRVEGGAAALSTWDFVEGVFCRDNIFFNTSSTAVSVNASSNTNGLVSFKFEGNDFDTCGGSGLFIDNISNIQVTDCWFSTITADALQIKSNVVGCIVSSNQFYPTAAGIRVEARDVIVNGNLISGGTEGITVIAGAAQIVVTGNLIENTLSFGVNFNGVATVQVSDNRFFNLAANTFANEPSGAFITNNSGDNGAGTSSSVAVTTSPFTYTAGPRPEYVNIFSGTVSLVAVGATTISTSTNTAVMLRPNQAVTVTYSSTPTMTKVVQ